MYRNNYDKLNNAADPSDQEKAAPDRELENDEVGAETAARDGEHENDENRQIERVPGRDTESQQNSNDGDLVELEKMSDYKSFSKGMMDIALMSANANQLRTALFYPFRYKWIVVGFIIMSMVLQVIASCLLILETFKRPKRYLNSSDHKDCYKKCQRYNIAIAISVILIIIVNIFITAFGVPDFEPGFHPDKEPSAPSIHPADNSFINWFFN